MLCLRLFQRFQALVDLIEHVDDINVRFLGINADRAVITVN